MARPQARILIVDDEPRNLSLLEAQLVGRFEEELTLVRGTSGREAIDAFRAALPSGGFDLVLLDVMMPEVDGLRALQEMRALTPDGEHVPIVLVTALGAREDRLRGLEAGADDFLTKPLDPHEVRCRVRTFLALRRTQRQLKARADELERLQRAKAELTRMIVHDLKNPLAAVAGNLGYLGKSLARRGIAEPALMEAIDDGQAGASRLLALIGSLVEVEKAETGALKVSRKSVEVGPFLDKIARAHRNALEEKAQSIEVAAEGAGAFELDAELVARVVENLLENARRYAPENGKIAIRALREKDALVVSVCNTGEPIPAALREKIFDKYVSTEEKGARGKNLGLGLYFCRLATRAHGGDITVDGDASWPTKFVIRLAPPAPARVDAPARPASPFLDE